MNNDINTKIETDSFDTAIESIKSISNNKTNSNSTLSVSSDEDNSTDEIDLTGETIENYNILYKLGKGSYSSVWLIYNTKNKKFFAMKFQKIEDINTILSEFQFIHKLPKKCNLFNNILEYRVENWNNIDYMCSLWKLHYGSLATLLKKYNKGLPLYHVKNIMRQVIDSIYILHTKLQTFHGDIKTDNILIKGINERDNKSINIYSNFIRKHNYSHSNITNIIMNEAHISDDLDKILSNNIDITLADFDTFCHKNDCFTCEFGTRYYQAPEIILLGACSFPVDIWALGCTFYELLTGELLFDPDKTKELSRDYHHLCLINDLCGKFPYTFLCKTKKRLKYFKYNRILSYNRDQNNNLYNKLLPLNLEDYELQQIYNILQKMLVINPNKRITINELKNHTYFT